jgi:hypothetical protein
LALQGVDSPLSKVLKQHKLFERSDGKCIDSNRL